MDTSTKSPPMKAGFRFITFPDGPSRAAWSSAPCRPRRGLHSAGRDLPVPSSCFQDPCRARKAIPSRSRRLPSPCLQRSSCSPSSFGTDERGRSRNDPWRQSRIRRCAAADGRQKMGNDSQDSRIPFQLHQPSKMAVFCAPIELRKRPAGHGKFGP